MKTALVTGASRGIGRAASLALAQGGARVLVHYGHGKAEADSVVAEIRAAGGSADALAADLGAPDGAHKLARQVIEGVLAGEGTPDEVVAARGLAIVSDEGALTAAVDEAIAAHPDVAQKVRDGKVAAAGALVGAVMKATRGQADAARVHELILQRLS